MIAGIELYLASCVREDVLERVRGVSVIAASRCEEILAVVALHRAVRKQS